MVTVVVCMDSEDALTDRRYNNEGMVYLLSTEPATTETNIPVLTDNAVGLSETDAATMVSV